MTQQAIEQLIHYIARLPSLGQRSAKRIVLSLLKNKEKNLLPFIQLLQQARDTVVTCEQCHNIDVKNPCHICSNPNRNHQTICVVEDMEDLWAMENAKLFSGVYHVLGGVLSAFQRSSPSDLFIEGLIKRLKNDPVEEVILALNTTIDSQTTLYYILDQLKNIDVKKTVLAQGMPIGGEIHYLDEGTLLSAFKGRYKVS